MNVLDNLSLLEELLMAPAPSGFERLAAKVFAREAATFAEVTRDHYGNTYATINPDGPQRVLLVGHIDEIGVMVSYVDDKGLISFKALGGWDSQVLVGQRVRLLAADGDLIAVVGKKPIHHMTGEERDKVSKISDLWLDTGLEAGDARRRVPIGTVGVIEAPFVRVGEHRVISKALDDRVGAFAVLEALRTLQASDCRHRVTAVATAQEEIGSLGARLAAVRERPTVTIAVDVGFETGQPGADVKSVGEAPFGSGAILSVSALVNPLVLRRLQDAASSRQIPTVLTADPRRTGTDLDELTLAGDGAPGAVVSIPCRYMHSPSEMVDLRDVQAVVDVLAGFVLDLPDDEDFVR